VESVSIKTEITDEDIASLTNRYFNESLMDMADDSVAHIYVSLDTDYTSNFVIPYKKVLSETVINDQHIATYYQSVESFNDSFNAFRDNTNNNVNYLVKEFEMRKAAKNYKRDQISKSGSLDMKKLYGYQLNDDIFKRITTTFDGKNHGMIFLLDWSGSMSSVLQDTLEQVIQLATFCYRIQIPFQVLAFTSYYSFSDHDDEKQKLRRNYESKCDLLDNATRNCNLLEFFSNKMTSYEFKIMTKRLFSSRIISHIPGYHLGGTPLNCALSYMTDYIGKFIKQNNIEKMTFITLTDGEGDSLRVSAYSPYEKQHKSIKRFLIDPILKKNYIFNSNTAPDQTAVLLTMIKDRYQTNNLGFYITNGLKKTELYSAVYNNCVERAWTGDALSDYAKIEVRKNGFMSLNSKGRDILFLIPSKTLKIIDDELTVNSKQTASSISKSFTKVLNKRQVNRVLLNQFISYIA